MPFNRKDFLKTLGLGIGSSALGYNSVPALNFHPRIIPKTLRKGDTIGMISPASSLDNKERYSEVKQTIEDLGFSVVIGEHAKDHFGYFAGTDKARAADLNAMFADTTIDAILPFRGGWGSNRILEFINFDLIRENPKPLIGYSDITSLLLAIYAKTGLITYHGPVGKSSWTDFTKRYARQALMEAQPFAMRNKTVEKENEAITTVYPGTASGVLLGGNLTVLTSMIGSGYLPDWNNSILFLEDVGEDVYRIDRMLTQLKLNGVFDKINGFIFGKCTDCEESEGYHFTLEQIIEDHIKQYKIPAYAGANIGHIDNMFTLPIGIQAKINASNEFIELLESPTNSTN